MKEKKILFVKCSSLGDVLQTVPALLFLKEHFPSAEFHWAVEAEYAPLLAEMRAIAQVIALPIRRWRKGKVPAAALVAALNELRKERYDFVVDLQGNTKSGLVTACSRGKKKIGIGEAVEWPARLFAGERYSSTSREIRKGMIEALGKAFAISSKGKVPSITLSVAQNGRILVAPFSRWASKMPPFASLEKMLEGVEYDLIAGNEEEDLQMRGFFRKAKNRYVAPSFGEWMKITAAACGILCVDSAQLHVARLLGKPVFALFGPSDKATYMEESLVEYGYQGKCPLNVTFEKRCPFLRSCTNQGCSKLLPDTLFGDFQRWSDSISKLKSM